jgi:tRNA threonylcarbamoyladenosine biosynthesis protein TsaE
METYLSAAEEDTLAIGRRLGERLAPPRVVLLFGSLGAGKTVLAKGIAEGLGVADSAAVHSPSFTLINRYRQGSRVMYHVDLYRLDSPREIYSTGIEDLLSEDVVMVVEWAERLPFAVEAPVSVRILATPDATSRRIEIDGLD